jgi:hypothetical protein
MRAANVLVIATFACLAGCASQTLPGQGLVGGQNLRIEQVNKAALADFQYCHDAACPQRTIKTLRMEDEIPMAPVVRSDVSPVKPDMNKTKKRVAKNHRKGGKKAKKPACKYVCVKQPVGNKQ